MCNVQGILTLFVLINFSLATFMDPGKKKIELEVGCNFIINTYCTIVQTVAKRNS